MIGNPPLCVDNLPCAVAKPEAIHIERTDSFTASAGFGRYLMQLVILSATVSAITSWVAPGDPGYSQRELAFVIWGLDRSRARGFV